MEGGGEDEDDGLAVGVGGGVDGAGVTGVVGEHGVWAKIEDRGLIHASTLIPTSAPELERLLDGTRGVLRALSHKKYAAGPAGTRMQRTIDERRRLVERMRRRITEDH